MLEFLLHSDEARREPQDTPIFTPFFFFWTRIPVGERVTLAVHGLCGLMARISQNASIDASGLGGLLMQGFWSAIIDGAHGFILSIRGPYYNMAIWIIKAMSLAIEMSVFCRGCVL